MSDENAPWADTLSLLDMVFDSKTGRKVLDYVDGPYALVQAIRELSGRITKLEIDSAKRNQGALE